MRILVCLLCLLSTLQIHAQTAILSGYDIVSPVQGQNGMVVTGEPLAAKVGLDVLKNGGNAIDAAVAIGFAQAVTLPKAGNIGGGGFMVIHLAKTDETIAIDFRETAPAKAYRDLFLNKNGDVDSKLSRFSHLSAGVPGTVSGMALALKQYGSQSLSDILTPAIQLAEKGFPVSSRFAQDLSSRKDHFQKWPASAKIFLKSTDEVYQPGDLFKQEDLARTLKTIQKNGPDAFYKGDVANLIVREMQQHGGLITKADLAAYKPVIRKPIKGTYQGHTLFSMPPPSSGGIHIVQILNILENFNLKQTGPNSAATLHHMAEAMKYAYADRSKFLGDPDFVDIPQKELTSKAYAKSLSQKINAQKATPSSDIGPGNPTDYESNQTTHYSVIDKHGNAVAVTYTINFSFGSGIVVDGAGFLLNNEMDDFSSKPGVPNAYGLIGGEANAIEPNKRMLSSMSPTLVLKNGKPILITGSPGGSRIITTTLQIILNVIDHGMNIQEAVNAPRMHHQWLPDELRVEEGLSSDTIRLLKKMGHTLSMKPTMGAAESIFIDPNMGIYYGAADPRREGLAIGY
ncbi:MAG: gamma-glutamyltransferase [Candidatus Latescibacteria bacterium]|nr:gamma-glutamyltransferase [Candidatus Latescibacterota bacterium]MBT5832608.1 gamma-glutamyltransferase [Candidatus Latescibacterota bacterium]